MASEDVSVTHEISADLSHDFAESVLATPDGKDLSVEVT